MKGFNMKELLLYHGSPNIVKHPTLDKSKEYADFGAGFYCSRNSDAAKEWACSYARDGYLNKYELNIDGLRVLDLTSKKYTTLHWLAVLAENRKFKIASPLMRTAIIGLKKNFHIDVEKYDIIVGYRADDSYYSFIRAFMNNEISLEQLYNSLDRTKAGKQYVIKSEKALDRIEFVGFEPVNSVEYYFKRLRKDNKARELYDGFVSVEDKAGLFIREFILREVHEDDPRLQR